MIGGEGWVGADELVAGWRPDLDLDHEGTPRSPLVVVDLRRPIHSVDVVRAAATAQQCLPVLVGVADEELAPSCRPLLDALDLTLAPVAHATDRATVAVSSPTAAAESMLAAARDRPRATVALANLVRQTSTDSVRAGLAAEAATFSMLLEGPEFRGWLRQRGPARPAAEGATSPVSCVRDNNHLRIVLNRPERRNAMNVALRESLVDALSVAVADPSLVVHVAGAGLNFCSGGDLDEFGSATDGAAAYFVRLERNPGWLLHVLRDRVTVAVHGACIGAGIEMSAFAGRIVADENSTFGLPEVGMGLVPGAGGTVSIPRRIGRWRTAWLGLTGSRIGATTALAWGLVDDIVKRSAA